MIIRPTTICNFARKQDKPMRNPHESKTTMQCQPIKPCCVPEKLSIDKFCKEGGETIERT